MSIWGAVFGNPFEWDGRPESLANYVPVYGPRQLQDLRVSLRKREFDKGQTPQGEFDPGWNRRWAPGVG